MKKITIELTDDQYARLNLLVLHYETTEKNYLPFLIFKEFLLHDFRSSLSKKLIEKKDV